MEWRKLSIQDRFFIQELLSEKNYRCSNYNFISMFIWKDYYKTKIARFGDMFILDYNGKFSFPLGEFTDDELVEIVSYLHSFCKENGKNLTFYPVEDFQKEKLSELFSNKFVFTSSIDRAEYIYKSSDFLNSSLKCNSKLRRKLNYFDNNYSATFEVLSKNNLVEVLNKNKLILEENLDRQSETDYLYQSLIDENKTVLNTLGNYQELNLQSIIVRIDGEIVGFGIFGEISSDTIDVFILKSDKNYKYVNLAILRAIVSSIKDKFEYINLEEDLGISGLRTFKSRLNPQFLLDKSEARFDEK